MICRNMVLSLVSCSRRCRWSGCSPSSGHPPACRGAVKPGTMESLTTGPAAAAFFTTRLQELQWVLLHTTWDVKHWKGFNQDFFSSFFISHSQNPGNFQDCGAKAPSFIWSYSLFRLLVLWLWSQSLPSLCFFFCQVLPLQGQNWRSLVWKNQRTVALVLFSGWHD